MLIKNFEFFDIGLLVTKKKARFQKMLQIKHYIDPILPFPIILEGTIRKDRSNSTTRKIFQKKNVVKSISPSLRSESKKNLIRNRRNDFVPIFHFSNSNHYFHSNIRYCGQCFLTCLIVQSQHKNFKPTFSINY